MKYILVLIFLLAGPLSAHAQHMYSRQFPFFNQLSSNEIFDIHQDREGYLWIGTTNGLARYDRYRLLNFRSDYNNQTLLADNAIINIDDNSLYVWFATWGGVNLYDKNTCRIISFPDERLRNKPISYVATDRQDNAWVGADKHIYRCDSTAHILKEYDLITPSGSNLCVINTIYVDARNRVWVMTTGGIFGYDAAADTFRHYPPFEIGTTAYTLYMDRSGNYWLGTWGEGLWQFFPEKEGQDCFKRQPVINQRNGVSESIIFSIEQDDTYGYLWMLSYAGLHALRHTDEGTLQNVDINHLIDTQMMYTRFCKDREGNLWLGSWDMAYTIFFDNSNVDNYPLPQLKKQMGWDANILNLCQGSDSIVWFDQDRYGLCLYDLSRDRFADSGLEEANIIIQSLHKPGVWVNSRYTSHVRRLTQQDMKVKIEEDIRMGGVSDLLEDRHGNLWIVTWTNLNVKRPDSEALVTSDKEVPMMTSLASDAEGEIWGVSEDRKIYRLTCTEGRIACEQKGFISELSDKEKVRNICFDRDRRLWLSTSLGRVIRSDGAMQAFESVPLDSMVNDCTVLGLLSDRDNVWIIANKKVLQCNIDSRACVTYSTDDENILVDVFRYKAISLDRRGGLFVGGHRGFIHIRPDARSGGGSILPRLHITDVKVEDKSIFFAGTPAEKNTADRIFLNQDDRNIEIFFSPLLYSLNARHRMAYRLEGVDKDWIYLDSDRSSAFYNHLTKGTYRLRLRLEYEPGRWTPGDVLLTIVKEPAFYETWLAYLLYALLAALCFYTVARLYLRRIRLKSEVKLQQELTRTKLTYFTNVSHELLTPLTVISCIADYFDQKVPAARQQSVMLRANADKLKRLIQQVLDFRKMDVGKLELSVSEGDIREFLLNICRINFLPLAQKKNILLDTCIEAEPLRGYADFDKLDKILHNLLSNALKYTPEGKRICVEVQVAEEAGRRMLVVKVRDEGIGIPARDIEHIFTRFYSSRRNRGIESNGIGLSLTKDLVTLHHGTIGAESVVGQGSCFTVKLPVDKESYAADELVDETMVLPADAEGRDVTAEEASPHDADKCTLLLIDDNTELLAIMKEMFRERYCVLTAADGQQAWEKLTNHEVDVIICDVMLPDVNGWELCTRIKGDLRFNHIPVIILTAKNGSDDRVASYEAGADAYVAKPFELRILLARVDNLLKSSRMRQAAFRKEENIDLEGLAYPSADKQFLQSIISSIEQHLQEPEYDLEQLAAEVGMSKSTLYRKIKSMTGMTPLDFVRNVKMKRACMMLAARTQNISEIAYAVGFSTPKYFTKCFKEEFGMTPSEYLDKLSPSLPPLS